MEYLWLLILSVLGFIVSSYVWYKNHHQNNLVCVIGKSDCSHVINSKYGKLLGIPLAVLAMAYFTATFIESLLIYSYPELFNINLIHYGKIIFSGIAALFSIYYLYIQIFVLKELCEFCITISAISIAVFLVIL